MFKKTLAFYSEMCYHMRIPFRGYSSVGRAFEWHSKGQGFDSPYLHHKKENGKEAGVGSSFFVYRVCNLRLGADAGGSYPESEQGGRFGRTGPHLHREQGGLRIGTPLSSLRTCRAHCLCHCVKEAHFSGNTLTGFPGHKAEVPPRNG